MGAMTTTRQSQDPRPDTPTEPTGTRTAGGTDQFRRGPGHPETGEKTRISVVLPAYNEGSLIESTVRHVAATMRTLADEFEIIVTNDGSVDETGAVLARLQQEEPELCLRVVTHERNRGYGAALASGFDAARLDLIFMTDGDKQFDVAELAGFLPALDDETDLVIGWRRHRADPPIRLLNAWGWKALVNGLFGYTARDLDCAFKLFRRSVWESLSVQARGATFSAELLIKAQRSGFRVRELPVSHFRRTRGSATGARLDVIVRAFAELIQLWLSLKREHQLRPHARQERTRALNGSTDRYGAPGIAHSATIGRTARPWRSTAGDAGSAHRDTGDALQTTRPCGEVSPLSAPERQAAR